MTSLAPLLGYDWPQLLTLRKHLKLGAALCLVNPYLSLDSTATQNTWRRGLALGNAPDARFLRWGYHMLVSWSQRKPFKFALAPTQNLKFALARTPTPDASQLNIGCVGSLALGLCVGHVHFIFFVLISFALGSRRKRSFQWNMGLTLLFYRYIFAARMG